MKLYPQLGCTKVVVAALGLLVPAAAEAAPAVERLSPPAGQVGNVVMLQGTGLAGDDLQVMFGRAPVLDLRDSEGSGRVLRLIVPNKVDPTDPDTVAVVVRVDGIEASVPSGGLRFTYRIPQPSPEITDYTTDGPSDPKTVLPGQPFVLTLIGSSFMLARRVPERCIALGGDREESPVSMDSSNATSTSCFFPGLRTPGDYEFLIAFSDGSGASVPAPGFVRDIRRYGLPPTIESVSFEANPRQAVRCDFTRIVEDYVCSQGVPGATAVPGVFLEGTFTHVRFQATVTDPDSTSTQSDVLLVAASFINPDSPVETSLVLFDDGSQAVFTSLQRAVVPEDCTDEGPGVCTCNPKSYEVHSGDALANDVVFTRDLAFVDRSLLSRGLLQDCILEQYRDVPIDFVAGSTLTFRIDAVDREGNFSTWSPRPAATIGTTSVACTGDECGCCLLTSSDPGVDCQGKSGMPSIDFPSGICLSVF